MAEEETERQSIDVTGFAILSFLSEREHTAKELRDLLEKFTKLEISRSPMYRRMRQLVNAGYVEETVKTMNQNNVFTLTESGRELCLEWADIFDRLVGFSPYNRTEEEE
jgi:DNA-binding PadR family transcriptional regulator